MTDLHTHILPGLDDGAESFEDSLEMAQTALESGVTAIAATSHANLPGRESPEERHRYQKQLNAFRQILSQERMGITIHSGMEIFVNGAYLERLQAGELLTLGNTRYVLVEFPMDGPARLLYRELDRMLERGFFPVLAHPERYSCVRRVPEHVQEWYEMGAVIQVNKGSVLGSFGRSIQRTAELLIHRGLVDVAASDAHSPIQRTTRMRELAERLEMLGGEECVWRLLEENPGRVMEGRRVVRRMG